MSEKKAYKVWKEYVKKIRHYDDKNRGVTDVMVPALTNKELHEYCKKRAGKVKKYKLGDDKNGSK